MNRQEFMSRLERCLADIPPGELEEAMQYYRDYLDDAGEQEQEALDALGTPEQVAESIKLGLRDGNEFGAFTENGFRMNIEEEKDSVSVRGGEEHEEQNRAGREAQQAGPQDENQEHWQQTGNW